MFKVPTRKLRAVRDPLFSHFYEEDRRLQKTRELRRVVRAGEERRQRPDRDDRAERG